MGSLSRTLCFVHNLFVHRCQPACLYTRAIYACLNNTRPWGPWGTHWEPSGAPLGSLGVSGSHAAPSWESWDSCGMVETRQVEAVPA